MNHRAIGCGVAFFVLAVVQSVATGGIVVFDDIDEFRAAAGPLVEIDFSVLPDGRSIQPFEIVPITPEFNYTGSGVTFSSPNPDLHVVGHVEAGTLLAVSKSSIRNWIDAQFAPPIVAVGIETLSAVAIYDLHGELLDVRSSAGFVGFISDDPLSLAVVDSNDNGAAIGSISFRAVPEPATLVLLAIGLLGIAGRTERYGDGSVS